MTDGRTGQDDREDTTGSVVTQDQLTEEPRRSEWWGILLRLVVAVAVLAGAYVGAAHYLGSRVPNGTSVHGVAVGGLTPQDAAASLEQRLSPLVTDPVTVVADGATHAVVPGEAGLGLDLDATLDGVTGVSYDPRVVWQRATGRGSERPLVTTVDREELERAVADIADEVDAEPREGSVSLLQGRARVVTSQTGRELDVAATADAVAQAWPDRDQVEATVTELPPELAQEEIDRFVAEDVDPALDGVVEVTVGEETARITPNQLSRLLDVVRSPGPVLALELDEVGLVELVRAAVTEAESPPRNASLRLGDDGPEVVPAVDGQIVDDTVLVERVREALSGGERAFEVPLTAVTPAVTTEDAGRWEVGEVMASFESVFPTGPANAARTENIRVGLSHLNGTVVMPGEQFSLGAALSPITQERGYVKAGVIQDGRLTEGLGGGLSQVSTTVLNTAWFAGVQLDEFTPHSYYITRYPAGREATIAVPSIDNRWTNDTPSPVLVETWMSGDTIHMRFWGERQYAVQTLASERTDVVEPEELTDDSPDCLPQSPQDGFTITVTRVLSQGGEEVSRRSWTTRYHPSDAITCTHPEAGR